MFPCEDYKTVSVCPYPEKRNHLTFVNISPILVLILHHVNSKIRFFQHKSTLNFDLCWRADIQVAMSQHAPVWRHRGCIVVPSSIHQMFDSMFYWSKQSVVSRIIQIGKSEVSERLSSSPCALVASSFGWTGNMERLAISNAHQKTEDTHRKLVSSP